MILRDKYPSVSERDKRESIMCVEFQHTSVVVYIRQLNKCITKNDDK